MTQPLETIFGELGITQYLDAFLEQGFDTWETILDITESDLDALGVKLGHRRKLQRRIANFRGIAPDASLVSPTQSTAEELKLQDAVKPEPGTVDGREVVGLIVTKRRYRRHPKPDENAPERPPSAYVLFSNKMREELKGRNLSFTEIAKLVGENWQNLTAAEKEPFESRAQAMKDKYLSDFAEYKKTPQYRKYQAYLQDFKAKHASPSQDKDASKRVRLSQSGGQRRTSPGATPTRTSRSGSRTESRRGSEPPPGRQRVGSINSTGESQYTASLASSAALASPEEPVLSPATSNPERHSFERSPTSDPDSRDPPLLSGLRHSSQGEDQGREQSSTHQHLPSLSDVFSAQRLPAGMRPPSEPSGYRFTGAPGPTVNHGSGDGRQPYMGNPSSYPSFGHPRPPVDGPLPIHALLTSKPEPSLHPNQPTHIHHDPYHMDQQTGLVHQLPNGAAGLPMLNGYHHHHHPATTPPFSHHQSPLGGHHSSPGFSPQSQPATVPLLARSPAHGVLPLQGKPSSSLDGMSALLKAGEIVGRRTQ